MSGVEDLVAKVPLFAGLSGKDRKGLAATMRERVFPAGTVITEVGQDGAGFFVIDSGTARVTRSGRELRTLGPGDHFGEIALIDEGPRTAQITADTELRCYGLAPWDFRPFVQSHPDVAWTLLQTLARRVREAEDRADPRS